MQEIKQSDWLYQYKQRIILGILLVLTVVIAVTMIFLDISLRQRLLDDSKAKTWELSEVIQMSLSELMLVRNPGRIQKSLETIVTGDSSIVKAFILDKNGKVAYSSAAQEIGASLDRFRDVSCIGCHTGKGTVPQETTMVIRIDGLQVLRNINIIHNEQPCHACHPPSDRINGKLIIDRSMESTSALITKVELILIASGVVCLIVLVPFLSRILSQGVNKYIDEILLKSTELTLLYRIVERLSMTIEMDELKPIMIDILREVFHADSIEIIVHKENRELSGIVWSKSSNKTERRMFGEQDPSGRAIHAWLAGELTIETMSDDRKVVTMPINRGNARLALIVITSADSAFNERSSGLMRAMSSHFAVAFENAALYQIAITDELTGLYSKRHFRSSLLKKFSLYEQFGEKMTLLMLDIDKFKKINDTYGHPAGDQVLKEAGQCIRASTRDEDMAFRYGGEEFAVILPASGSKAGLFVAERIRKKIEDTVFHVDGHELRMTISIGVASCPDHAASIRELTLESDKALYEAKRTGRNRVVLSRGSTF